MKCSECGATNGDDWSQCIGKICPIPSNPKNKCIQCKKVIHDDLDYCSKDCKDLYEWNESDYWNRRAEEESEYFNEVEPDKKD